jgi:hypothetical protein
MLAQSQPLALLPACGQALIEYWLEYLAMAGARNVLILASDRPEQVRKALGDGRRWGLAIDVIPQARELSIEQGRARYADAQEVTLIDHLPGQAESLFESYSAWFRAVQELSSRANGPTRIGVREIRPGVRTGLRTRVNARAALRAPCWLGNDVHVGADAVIGPGTVIEDRCLIEAGAEVSTSHVGRDTYVGAWTEVRNSIAFASTLINWQRDSCIEVPDPFLLGDAAPKRVEFEPMALLGRLAAAMAIIATAPLPLYVCLKCAARRQHPLREVTAVRLNGRRLEEFSFYEFTNVNRWVRRWPQLWSIVSGDLCWVGNRPISAWKANRLGNDFERLWLHAPVGLVSLGDVRGWMDSFADEARVHASFYAVQRNWRLDLQILCRAPIVFLVSAAERLWENELVPAPVRQWLRAEYPTIHRT